MMAPDVEQTQLYSSDKQAVAKGKCIWKYFSLIFPRYFESLMTTVSLWFLQKDEIIKVPSAWMSFIPLRSFRV